MTTTAGPATAEALSRSEALVAMLIAAARADGTVSPHEANQIEHVVSTMRLFRGVSLEKRNAIFTAAADRIREQGMDRVVRESITNIPRELAATTFALAVDLMLLDGELTANEQRFADELRKALEVDLGLASRIIDVLTIKNAG